MIYSNESENEFPTFQDVLDFQNEEKEQFQEATDKAEREYNPDN